jgi:hypothetical protein
MTRTGSRRQVHTRRARRRFRGFDWEMDQFAEIAANVPDGINAQEVLIAIAECDELWDLIREAADLKKRRNEVLDKIKKIRNSIAKPFEKKAKAAKRG